LAHTQTKENPSADAVWANLREVAASQKEYVRRQKEKDELLASEMKERVDLFSIRQEEDKRRMKERAENFEKEMKEWDERSKETAARLSSQLGKFGSRFGDMPECMVEPNMVKEFEKLGFVFKKTYRDTLIKDKENKIYTRVDITLDDGDVLMLVKVMPKPKTEDVTEHIERIEKVILHEKLAGKEKRRYMGALAGVVYDGNVKKYAMKNGLYVIESSGDTFAITAPSGVYSPREW